MSKGQKRTSKEPKKAKNEGSKDKKDAGPKYLRGQVTMTPGDIGRPAKKKS